MKKELKKRKDLVLAVKEFLIRVEEAESLQPFENSEEISFLPYDRFYEMRIPKTRSGGVVRIYFILHPENPKLLALLDGELKKGKESKIKSRVKKRKRDFLESLK